MEAREGGVIAVHGIDQEFRGELRHFGTSAIVRMNSEYKGAGHGAREELCASEFKAHHLLMAQVISHLIGNTGS